MPQPAKRDKGGTEGGHLQIGVGHGGPAAAHLNGNLHLRPGVGDGFDVQDHAVLEPDAGEPRIGDNLAREDAAGLAEIAVGPVAKRVGDGAGFGRRGLHDRVPGFGDFVFGRGFGHADGDQRRGSRPGADEIGLDVGRGDVGDDAVVDARNVARPGEGDRIEAVNGHEAEQALRQA